MKRYHHLFEEIRSFKNLLKAAKKAQKGKRFKSSTAGFNLELEKELFGIQKQIENKTYKVGRYKNFYIFDPKKRLISALPYRDRVVQHALCNVIEPLFDKTFIYDNYACRKNKGSLKAVNRFTEFFRRNNFVLKCDIKNYFASIDHEVLFGMISKKIKDPEVLRLIKLIIASTPDPGIPIGNLTSQIFANLYLNELDHYIKEKMGCRCYIRYMDDLVFFDNNRDKLDQIRDEIKTYLSKLKLTEHSDKCRIYQAEKGADFLGYKIFPDYKIIARQNIKRVRKRMKGYFKLLNAGLITRKKILDSIKSWLGFAIHADSYNARRKLLLEFNLLG